MSLALLFLCVVSLGLFQEFGSIYSRSLALLVNVHKMERISDISGLESFKNGSFCGSLPDIWPHGRLLVSHQASKNGEVVKVVVTNATQTISELTSQFSEALKGYSGILSHSNIQDIMRNICWAVEIKFNFSSLIKIFFICTGGETPIFSNSPSHSAFSLDH